MLNKLLKELIKDSETLDKITHHKQIYNDLRQLYHEEEKAKQECNEKLSKFQKERCRLQEKCQHLSTTSHSETYGSYCICDICGKEW